jgi:hypothetical protein
MAGSGSVILPDPVNINAESTPPVPALVQLATNMVTMGFRVRTQNQMGTSVPSPVMSYTVEEDSFEGVPLRWPPVAGATNYMVEVSTNGFQTICNVQNYGLACDVPYPFAWTNTVNTAYVQGTGDVFAAASMAGPWIKTRTNLHGVYKSWTNVVPPTQFLKGPGMTNIVLKYN